MSPISPADIMLSEALVGSLEDVNPKTGKNYSTGAKYEHAVEFLLENFSTHSFVTQKVIGYQRNGSKHRPDIILNGNEIVSLKYQSVNGTAETKILHECMVLNHAIEDSDVITKATIILAGNKWTWRDYYLSETFHKKEIPHYPGVRVISHQQFVNEYLITE